MHVYDLIYFHYLQLFINLVLSLDTVGDLLMYLSLSVMHCITSEL